MRSGPGEYGHKRGATAEVGAKLTVGMWEGLLAREQKLILQHILSTLLIEGGLGAVSLLGHWTMEPPFLTWFIVADEFAMFVVFLWLLWQLFVTLWNNRERLGGSHVFVLS
jgi:hypothetical protein